MATFCQYADSGKQMASLVDEFKKNYKFTKEVSSDLSSDESEVNTKSKGKRKKIVKKSKKNSSGSASDSDVQVDDTNIVKKNSKKTTKSGNKGTQRASSDFNFSSGDEDGTNTLRTTQSVKPVRNTQLDIIDDETVISQPTSARSVRKSTRQAAKRQKIQYTEIILSDEEANTIKEPSTSKNIAPLTSTQLNVDKSSALRAEFLRMQAENESLLNRYDPRRAGTEQVATDDTTDSDSERKHRVQEPNPLVEINVQWKSYMKKVIKVRKMDDLKKIENYFERECDADPRLLFVYCNNQRITLAGQSYISLRLNSKSVMEVSVLPEDSPAIANGPILPKSPAGAFIVYLQYSNRERSIIHVTPDDKLEHLFAKACIDKHLNFGQFKIVFDGEQVDVHQTFKQLDVDNEDCFDCILP